MVATILIDTAPLVLLVVGTTKPGLISRHTNTRDQFAEDDYLRLKLMIGTAEIVVTPHILTETSNLVRQIGHPLLVSVMATYGALLTRVREHHVPAADVGGDPLLGRFGITDAAATRIAAMGPRLLTTDGALYAEALKVGNDAILFRPIGLAA